MSLEAEAKSLGIPMKIKVDNQLRYSYCDAHMATLVSIEGKHALYKGQCINRHTYEVRRLVSELQQEMLQSVQIINGQVTLGKDEGFSSPGLAEY